MSGGLRSIIAAGALIFVAPYGVHPTPARAQDNGAKGGRVDIQQGRQYTALQAQELSKNPRPQIVLHYDATMFDDPAKNTVYVLSVISMAKVLRNNGYHAIAVPGGPKHGVRVFIAGLTSDKLVYSPQQIEAGDPMNYAAGYYKRIIGEPEGRSLPTPAAAQNNNPKANSSDRQQAREYTALQAQELSKTPRPQIVFHYDATMTDDPGLNRFYKSFIRGQAKTLREEGYHAVAVPGGPEGSARVFIAGLTSDKLVYTPEQIEAGDLMNYAAAYYKHVIGQPEGRPIAKE